MIRRLVILLIAAAILLVAAAPQPQVTQQVDIETQLVSATPDAVTYTSKATISFYVGGIKRSFDRLTVRATWYAECVKVEQAFPTRWVASGWGYWSNVDKTLGPSSCKVNYVRRATWDIWHPPEPYKNKNAFLSSIVYASDPGNFNWFIDKW